MLEKLKISVVTSFVCALIAVFAVQVNDSALNEQGSETSAPNLSVLNREI